MLSRRLVLMGTCALSIAINHQFGFGEEPEIELETPVPPLPKDLTALEDQPVVQVYDETAPVGVQPPSQIEIEAATDILFQAPYTGRPLDVAKYFLEVSKGTHGQDLRQFAREWPVRANPVIHQFFTATRTLPAGDGTPWCAAFLNWCIARVAHGSKDVIGRTPGYYIRKGKPFSDGVLNAKTSRHASSGSFRCWPKIDRPAEGDIAVWRNKGTEKDTKYCLGQGHVAFFLEELDGGIVRILGGNQVLAGSGGAVTQARMRKTSATKALHAYVSSQKE